MVYLNTDNVKVPADVFIVDNIAYTERLRFAGFKVAGKEVLGIYRLLAVESICTRFG